MLRTRHASLVNDLNLIVMKKMFVTLISVLVLCQLSYAQWSTGTGGIYYNSGTVTVGLTGPTTISPPPFVLFPSAIPKMEVMTGSDTGTYSQLVTIRHNSVSPSAVSRQLGLILKLSNEASWTESSKMGGMLLESSSIYANTPSLSFVTQNLRRMTIDYQGDVGIGTTIPIAAFQVGSAINKATMGSASGANLNYGSSYLGFNAARDPAGTGFWTIQGDGSNNGGGVIYSGVGGDMYFAPVISTGGATQTLADTAIKNRIVFRVSGNGRVYAKQINVQLTGWPDYVFKPSYHLLPLTEVKTYIDQNQHLPDIPSETDIAKDGLNLGEMNKLLVKKVEELTLYIIEQDKRIEREQQKQKELEQKVNAQQTQMDALNKILLKLK